MKTALNILFYCVMTLGGIYILLSLLLPSKGYEHTGLSFVIIGILLDIRRIVLDK